MSCRSVSNEDHRCHRHACSAPRTQRPLRHRRAATKFHWEGKRSRITPKRPTPMLEYNVVRIETDTGLVGVGEAQADIGFFGETVEEVGASVKDYLGPQLVGKIPSTGSTCWD